MGVLLLNSLYQNWINSRSRSEFNFKYLLLCQSHSICVKNKICFTCVCLVSGHTLISVEQSWMNGGSMTTNSRSLSFSAIVTFFFGQICTLYLCVRREFSSETWNNQGIDVEAASWIMNLSNSIEFIFVNLPHRPPLKGRGCYSWLAYDANRVSQRFI